MIIFIYVCILALNLVAVFLTYHFLGKEMDKKEKGIFIIVGIAVIYMLVSLVYWIGTKDIELGTNENFGKNLITFTFVPVNAIVILPFLASSYKNLKANRLKPEAFRNRCILLATVLIALLVMECSYFKDIQTGIYNMLQSVQNTTSNVQNKTEQNATNQVQNNAIQNATSDVQNTTAQNEIE